jgi:4-hydroxy 2-oxovalerate aldolase
MKNRFSLLDCSLRDGGLLIDYNYGFENILKIVQLLCDAGIDIIELGLLRASVDYDRDKTLFSSIEQIRMILEQIDKKNSRFAAMIVYPEYDIDNLPENSGLIDLIRVIVRYSDLKGSLDFTQKVANRGYEVSIQPAVTARFKDSEIDLCIKAANEINAYSIYFVDTFGYLAERDIERFFDRFDCDLNDSVLIGYHSHNNMNNAFVNAKHFIKYSSRKNYSRQILLDSTLTGHGQGSGNLQTELIVGGFLPKHYDLLSILDACEIIEQYNNRPIWGYSVIGLIGALTRVNYMYANYFHFKTGLSYRSSYELCKNIPNIDDMPARFNVANAQKIFDAYLDITSAK